MMEKEKEKEKPTHEPPEPNLPLLDGAEITAAGVREYLANAEAELAKKHSAGATGFEITAAYTRLIDDLLKHLFGAIASDMAGVEKLTALVATGGYGREELNVRSDVDLMLLYKKSITPTIEDLTQKILYILWDAGMDVGFSIRSVKESTLIARDDLKTMTALLDSRFLLGNRALFDSLEAECKKRLLTKKRVKAFIAEKIEETRTRHEKFGNSVYILEPNVKEGEGGLRDLHQARWIQKALLPSNAPTATTAPTATAGARREADRGATTGAAGATGAAGTIGAAAGAGARREADRGATTGTTGAAGAIGAAGATGAAGAIGAAAGPVLSDRERKLLDSSVDFLLWVRNDIHFSTGRKTDQLTFDQQERIASHLGFRPTDHSLPVESFMQHYYRHASNINHLSNLMISRMLDKPRRKFPWPTKKLKIDKDFIVDNGALTVTGDRVFKRDTAALMSAFEYAQVFDVDMDQHTRDLILRHLSRVDDTFRNSPAAAESFIKILRGKDVFKALSLMHELRFLERYIPEFGEISCKVQHDLYHIYTVDTHTLFAIRELERLKGPYRDEFPLLATLYEEVENPEALMLGVLLHDIGKSLGKGHAEKGAQLVPAICTRLGLAEDTANMVHFLVKNHLLLADTAQYRDLYDEKLIVDFARKVADVERLNLLYLITFADVRAVGPDIWNNWKGALFQDLYFKALSVIERGSFEVTGDEGRIRRTKGQVLKILSDTDRRDVDDYFDLLHPRYFLSNTPEAIAEHIGTKAELKDGPFVLKVKQDRDRKFTEITVCTYDIHGLFSMITGVMAANSVNILNAQINTLKNGIALDVLHVNTVYGELITDEAKINDIRADLGKVLSWEVKVQELVAKMRPSMLDKRARPMVSTRVQVDNEVSDIYTVLDIRTQDKLGLLYSITSTLSALGLYIHISKISTKGGEATDIFYVKDVYGQKIIEEKRLKEIVDAIYDAIGPEAKKPENAKPENNVPENSNPEESKSGKKDSPENSR